VAKNTRIPSAVGAIPVVGELMKQADSQARWLQELVEQNARLLAQLPTTVKTFNDSLERFNQTITRLDRVVTSIEGATSQFVGPLEQVTPRLERLVADTQKQVALLGATLDRVITVLNDLPGAGFMRRLGGIDRKPESGI
jgi:ABC-type transporter Mla subunit MlaD